MIRLNQKAYEQRRYKDSGFVLLRSHGEAEGSGKTERYVDKGKRRTKKKRNKN